MKSSITAIGREAPPEAASRNCGRRSSWRAAASSATYIVGTPTNTVTPVPSMTSMTVAGSNRGTSEMVAPTRNPPFMTTVCPKEWNSGRAPKMTSSPRMSIESYTETVAFHRTLSCVSTAPLGLPVVPDV